MPSELRQTSMGGSRGKLRKDLSLRRLSLLGCLAFLASVGCAGQRLDTNRSPPAMLPVQPTDATTWFSVPKDCPLTVEFVGKGRSISFENLSSDAAVLSLSFACWRSGSFVNTDTQRLTNSVKEGYRLGGIPIPADRESLIEPGSKIFMPSQAYWQFFSSRCEADAFLRIISIEYVGRANPWMASERQDRESGNTGTAQSAKSKTN